MLVGKGNRQSFVQVGNLLETFADGLGLEFDRFKNRRVRIEGNLRSGVALFAGADDRKQTVLKLGDRLAAVFVFVVVNAAALANLNHHLTGQGVYNRSADAVQTAGYLVGGVAEFAARMQNGINHTLGRNLLRWVNVNRDAAAMVNERDAAVFVKSDVNLIAVSRQMLVDPVVENLPHQVVKTAGTGGADVHTGTLANSFKAFENYNLTAVVFCHFNLQNQYMFTLQNVK